MVSHTYYRARELFPSTHTARCNLFRRSRSFIYVKIPVGTPKDKPIFFFKLATDAIIYVRYAAKRVLCIHFYFFFASSFSDFSERVESLIYGDKRFALNLPRWYCASKRILALCCRPPALFLRASQYSQRLTMSTRN